MVIRELTLENINTALLTIQKKIENVSSSLTSLTSRVAVLEKSINGEASTTSDTPEETE